MKTIFIICIIIVIVVLLLSVLTTSKAYQYKHTVDPIKKPDELPSNENDAEKDTKEVK
jgi:FtsZ-interacting cell division protein ZipA